MQVLVQEGLFYTVAGAGTFVGQRQLEHPEYYLYVISAIRQERELKNAFEEEIAARGGTTLVMTREQAIESRRRGLLPEIRGFFTFLGKDDDPLRPALDPTGTHPVPEVNFDDQRTIHRHADIIRFNDIEGGRQAARHLLRNGHQEIAFLGLHAAHDSHDSFWSVQRMQGWREVMENKGIPTENLLFLPAHNALRAKPGADEWILEAAHRLLRESNATAVVTTNDDVALQLIAACRTVCASPRDWPAIVSFDGTLPTENNLLTSLRLPWGELGRMIASTLWDRAHGQLTGEPILRLAPMRMIPRLTCQANWSLIESLQTV